MQTTISAAKPIEQTGCDPESSRFGHKSPSQGSQEFSLLISSLCSLWTLFSFFLFFFVSFCEVFNFQLSRFERMIESLVSVPIRRGRGWGNTPGSRNERPPPVLSPGAAALMRSLLTHRSPQDVWNVLDALPRCVGSWEDLMETVAEFRRHRKWRSVIVVWARCTI